MELIERAARIVLGRLEKLTAEGSADAIALTLETQGVTGVRKHENACAVAVYLSNALDEELGAEHAVRIRVPATHHVKLRTPCADFTSVSYIGTTDNPMRDMIEHPINQFIAGFDNGEYPNLVRE